MLQLRTRLATVLAAGQIRPRARHGERVKHPLQLPFERPRSVQELLICPSCAGRFVQIWLDAERSTEYRFAYVRRCGDCGREDSESRHFTTTELGVLVEAKRAYARQMEQAADRLANPALTLYPAALGC